MTISRIQARMPAILRIHREEIQMAIVNTSFSTSNSTIFNAINTMLSTSIRQISSGLRVNSSADDPSSISLIKNLNSSMRGLNQAITNAETTGSFLDTASVAIEEIRDKLLDMRDLALTAQNGVTLTASDRAALNASFSALRDDITALANEVKFGNRKVLDGTFAGGKSVMIGIDTWMTLVLPSMMASAIAGGTNSLIGANITLSSVANATSSVDRIDIALDYVNSISLTVGVQQNRVSGIIDDLESINVSYSYSFDNIAGADMAEAASNFAKYSLMLNSATAVAAQTFNLTNNIIGILDLWNQRSSD